MRKIFFLAVLIIIPTVIIGQSNKSLKMEMMKKVAFLEGKWKGEGWYASNKNKKFYFNQTEDVQPELNGLILRIEGIGKTKENEKIFHHAFAVIYYDSDDQTLKMHSYKGGEFLETDAMINENGEFVWGFDIKNGKLRYTIGLNEKGQWHEIGEFSRDGKRWFQNFEMTLDKVEDIHGM